MKHPPAQTPLAAPKLEEQKPVSLMIQVDNLHPHDREFLRGVIALFCDPAQITNRAALYTRAASIYYHPGGRAKLCPVHKLN